MAEPFCETCEGAHADHATWLAEKAAAAAEWSESAKALEEALNRSRLVLSGIRAAKRGPGEPADEQAMDLYREISRQAARLRQVTDAAAWRAQQEAEAATGVPSGQ